MMRNEIGETTLASINKRLGDHWRNLSMAEANRVTILARTYTEADPDALARMARVPAEAVKLILGEIGTRIGHLAEQAMQSVRQHFLQAVSQVRSGKPKAKYDQLFATERTVIERVQKMLDCGDVVGKKIILLGDDDLLSVALSLTGLAKSICVLDIDTDLVKALNKHGSACKVPFEAFEYDVRKGVPQGFMSSADVAFTDPPYTPDGQRIFFSRALDMLKTEDGSVIYLCQSPADLSPMDLMLVHGAIQERNFLIDALWKSFNTYQEAKRSRGETVIKNFTSDLLRLVYVRNPRAYTKPRPSKLFEYRYR